MSSQFQLFQKDEECLPITLLEDLKLWKPLKAQKHDVQPLPKKLHNRIISEKSPKTLLCHDMKGGYLDDRFLNGSINENNYYFIHWSMIDIFVYFSHHLVTVPPCGWITAAHRNEVRILGTFITEWDAGAKICDIIFSDMSTVHEYCMQLVRIADFFQFDGWLINIENKLNKIQVPLLQEFVRFLTLKMHQSQEGSLVIWYDSVIESGELKWQNELNHHNRNFFHACDGIFLNYNWTKDTLKSSVAEAGVRRSDVFVGVDVFGRGCLGGGGFSTNIAVTAARNYNLSVAIFAPGWVYEMLDVKDFKENQYQFWDFLTELCVPREIKNLPYYSSFCPGFGQKVFRSGKVEHSQPWFNLSLQQPQPSFHYTNCSAGGARIVFHTDDAFSGGGCLRLAYNIPEDNKLVNFEILSNHFILISVCTISYTFKPLNKNTKVALVLGMSDLRQFYHLQFLEQLDTTINDAIYSCLCSECMSLKENCIYPVSEKIIRHSDEGQPWIKRKYRVHSHNQNLCVAKKVQLQIMSEEETNTEVSVLLGELLISPSPNKTSFSFKDLTVVPKDDTNVVVECVLEWTLETCIDFSDLYIYIQSRRHFICTTSQFYYNFKGCFSKDSFIEFFLSPKCSGKTLQPLFLRLHLPRQHKYSSPGSVDID